MIIIRRAEVYLWRLRDSRMAEREEPIRLGERHGRTTLRSIDPNARTRRRRLDATSMASARRGYRGTAHHRRARTRLRRPDRPEWGRQPASHDDFRRLSRWRRALRHRLRIRRWR